MLRTVVFCVLIACAFASTMSMKACRTKCAEQTNYPACLLKCLAKDVIKHHADKLVDTVFADFEVESDIAQGAKVVAKSGIYVRKQPCTNAKVVGSLAAGSPATYTGKSKTACGHTWWSIRGPFGAGWSSSKFLSANGQKNGGKKQNKPKNGGKKNGGKKPTKKPTKPTKKPTKKPTSKPTKKPSTPTSGNKYPLFKQCDSRWGGNKLGSSTVCRIGCLMSSVSMALAGLGKKVDGQAPNPGTLNHYLSTHHGYQGNLFIWSAVSHMGLSYQGQTRDKAKMKADISAGKVVVLNVNHGGHWVLAHGHSGSSFLVNDPGFSRTSYSDSEVGLAGVYSH